MLQSFSSLCGPYCGRKKQNTFSKLKVMNDCDTLLESKNKEVSLSAFGRKYKCWDYPLVPQL